MTLLKSIFTHSLCFRPTDDGLHVMVWIGGQASVNERRFALNFGVSYLVKYNRPLETPLSRFLEGAETKVTHKGMRQGCVTAIKKTAPKSLLKVHHATASSLPVTVAL